MRFPCAIVALFAVLGLLIAVRSSEAAVTGNYWVSLDKVGTPYGQASGAYSYPPALSDNGTLVAFESLAPLDFEADKNGVSDVFVRDSEENVLSLVSENADGEIGNNRSYGATLSADGNLVAFESLATNLVERDANNASDIYLRDVAAGTTALVSAPAGGEADSASYRASISGDGKFVAFCSLAKNLVADDTNNVPDVFLWERATGAISRIEVPGSTGSATDGCLRTAVNNDASEVAFAGVAAGTSGVFVWDRANNATTALTTDANGPSGTGGVAISGDGNIVAFDSVADNLITDDSNRSRDVFSYDRSGGTTKRISVRTSGSQLPGDSGASGVSISRDGRYVVFGSTAKGVVPGDSNGREDVFRHDLSNGETRIASVNLNGQSANNSSYSPSVSADGSAVAFTSLAANLVNGDSNRQPDVFVRGTDFLDNAGSSSGPEDTGAPVDEATTPVKSDDGGSSLLLYGGIAAGVIVLLIAASMFLGRRGRA